MTWRWDWMSDIFNIRKLCTGYINKLSTQNHKSAFTTAEMLIVLLIISFLVIAIPPIVNKKIEKRLRRGDHGRYECFVRPEDGHLYEYLATERGGQIFGANGHDLGVPGAEGSGRCRFKPQEYASTASYFMMQIIGGGGGGAYPPYDANLHYQRVTDSTNKVRILRQPENSHAGNNVREYLHSGSQYFNTKMTYAHDRTSGYDFLLDGQDYESDYDTHDITYTWNCTANNTGECISGTTKFKNCNTKRWVYDYFPPVVIRRITGDGIGLVSGVSGGYISAGGGGIRVCSGHGARAYAEPIPNTSNTSEILDENENPISITSVNYTPQFGHRGGFGFCMKAGQFLTNIAGEDHENDSAAKKAVWNRNIALGRDEGDFFKITTNAYINSIDYAMYYREAYNTSSLKLASFADYLYDPKTVTLLNSEGEEKFTALPGPYNGDSLDASIVHTTGFVGAVMCPYTGQSGKNMRAAKNSPTSGSVRYGWPMSEMDISSLDTSGQGDSVCENALDWRKATSTASNFPTLGSGNWKWPNVVTSNGLASRPEVNFFRSFLRDSHNYSNVSALDMGLTIEAKHYNYLTGEMENANCNIPGGRNADSDIGPETPLSEVPDPNDALKQNEFGDVTIEQVEAAGCNTDVWNPIPADPTNNNRPLAGQNVWARNASENIMGRKHTYPIETWFSNSYNSGMVTGFKYDDEGNQVQVQDAIFSAGTPFPSTIHMTRISSEYSTTYGFGGRPGEAVGLSYSNLTGTIEIQLGEGGAAGQSGNEANRTGGTGGNTVVWRKSVGTPDETDCSAPDNADNANCSRMAIAQGGLGHKEGAVGKVISLKGERTCNLRDAENDTWTVRIDACLDAGAGPRSANARNGGNELRFAENSNFYIVPELDQNSNTRSLLEEMYQGFNMPGSGGDGGYTFLYKIDGGSETDTSSPGDAEQVTANPHPNFTPEAMRLLGAGDWFMIGSRTDFTLRTTPESTEFDGHTGNEDDGGFGGYRCYRRNDTVSSDGHGGTGNFPAVLDTRTGLCAPQRGEAGAVVIVW